MTSRFKNWMYIYKVYLYIIHFHKVDNVQYKTPSIRHLYTRYICAMIAYRGFTYECPVKVA